MPCRCRSNSIQTCRKCNRSRTKNKALNANTRGPKARKYYFNFNLQVGVVKGEKKVFFDNRLKYANKTVIPIFKVTEKSE